MEADSGDTPAADGKSDGKSRSCRTKRVTEQRITGAVDDRVGVNRPASGNVGLAACEGLDLVLCQARLRLSHLQA